MELENKDLEYWKNNAEEDYLHTPISVLKYITELESSTTDLLASLQETLKELEYSLHNSGAAWMPDYDKRQEVINQNTVVVKAKAAIEKALK